MPNNNSPYYDIKLDNGQKYQWNEKQFAEGADELYRQFPKVEVFKVAKDNPEIEVDDTDQFEVTVSGKTYNWNADQYRSGASLLREQFPDATISRRSDVNLRRDRDFARQYERAKKYAYDGSIPEGERAQYKTFIDENAGRYGEVIGQVGEAPEMEMPPGIIPMENGPQETGATAPRTESVQGAAAGGGSRSGSEQQPLVQGAEPESGEKKSWIRRDFNFNLGSLGTMFNETMRSTARMLTGGIDDTVLKDAREEFERRLSSNEPTFQYNNENEGALLPQDWRKTAAERDQKKHDRAVNRIINAYREEALKKGADPIEYTKEKLSRKSGLPEKIEEKSSELIQENEPSKMGGLAAMGLTTAASIGLAATGNTGAAATVANATLAMFAATGAGASIEQAKQAGATDDQAYAAGIASGAIMYGFAKLPIGKFIKNVTPKAVTSAVGGIVGKAGKGAVTSEMDKLLSDAAKRGIVTPGYAKEYLSQFAGSWGKNIAHSTGSFAAMSGISALVPLIYEDPDEYPVLASVLQSALKGAEDGFIMGAFAGGMSSALEYRNRMNYWKSRGKVTLAEVQPGAGDMLAMYDRKLGKWVPVMEGYTPNGEMHMGEIVGTTGDIPAGETVMGMSNAGVSRQSSAVAVRMDDGNIYVVKPEAVKASRTFKVGKKYDATSGDAEFQEQDFRDAYTDAGYDEGQAAQSSGDPAATSEVSRKVKYMTEKAERERQNTGAVSEETQLDLDRAEQARQGRRDTLRQQMEEKLGKFHITNSLGEDLAWPAKITDAEGNEKNVYIVASTDDGIAFIDVDGNKGSTSWDQVREANAMDLNKHLDTLLAEQDKLAEEGRQSAELQNSVNELRSRVQQMAQNGESINVGTPETDVPGIVVGSDDSGVMVQVEGEKTPRVLPWEQVANKLGVSLNPKTDDDMVSGLMARDAKVEEYNTIPKETTLLRNVEGIDQPVKYRFTGAGLDEYGNIVLNATLDATGESAVLYPEDVSNLSEIMTGRSVLSDTEGNPVPVPTEAEQPVATFSDPTANALGIDSKYAVTTKNGNVEVNGSLLWAEDPVMWARWNDANPDKVMSTAEYLNNKLAEIGEESAAVEQALRAEVSGEQRPDVLEDLRQRRQEITERAGVIEGLAKQYSKAETDAVQQEVEAVNATAEVPVDVAGAKQYAQSTPEQTLTDLRNDPSFTSPEEVAQFIDGKVKRAEKAVSKAQKEADKITADKYDTPAEYRAAKDEKLAAVQPLQQELDHWTAVRDAAMAPAASVADAAPVMETPAPSPVEVAQAAMDEINSRISPDMPETRRNEAMREKAAAIQRMLDDIGMENTTVTTREDILGRYRKDGASWNDLEALERKLEETKAKRLRFRGFQHLGNVYLLADDLRSATDAVKTQAHEDKHLENRTTRANIDALETGVTDDEMRAAVRKLTKTTMYDTAGSEALSDEVMANAAEIAVESGIDAVPEKLRDAGINNEEFINFVQKNINDGRTRSGYLSEGPGDAHGAVSAEISGGQDGRSPEPESREVGGQRVGPAGGSAEGTRGEEVQVEQAERQAISEEGVSSMSQAAIVDENKPLLSIRTEHDVQNKIREFAKSEEGRNLGWTDEKIEEIIRETEDLIDAIHSAVNGDKYYDEWSRRDPTIKVDWRDGVEKPTVTWARANIEYKYDMSADLLCINNEGLEEVLASPVMADLMLAMNRTTKEGFTSDDYLRLYSTLRDMGFVVPCKGCFDAAMRLKMLPSVSRKFVDLVNKTIDERNEDPETFDANLRALAGDESTIGGLPVAAKNKEMAVRIGVAGDNLTEHINWTQLMSAEGQTKALSDWGGIFRAWQRTGAGRPKDKLLPEPWSGDIVSSTTTIIGKYGEKTPSYRDINVNQGTGLRRNSHSEFRPLLAIDEIQFMREAFIRNLTVFKYMKELDDVRLFGNLGVKFNMSFFPAFVEGAPAAGLDKEGNYIAAEESVGGREYEYVGEDGKTHYDGMRGWQEAQKYINKDVSLSSVVFSVPHLIKAFTDVPTARDPRGMWGSLIPFHASGATAGSLKEQGLGSARALGVGHDFETEAFVDYNKGVTNFEAVQNDRFGEGWEVVDGVKAGTAVEPGHKLEFVNGTHYYNKGRGVHLFSSFYILDSELKPEHFDKKGKIIPAKAKADGHAFVVDYNDKVRELGTDTAYQEASDYYINALREIGLVPRFEFQVPEDVFLKMCSEINVDPNHPKLGWKGPGNSWSPTDSEACYSLWCDYGMIDPATGHIAMHNPVGVIKEDGSRVFELPENAIEIIKDGVARYSTRKSREESRTLEAIEEYAKRSVADGKLRQEDVDAILAEARKEDSEFRASVVSDEESQRLFDAAKNLFGTTRDIKEAGYILPDGTMLDFSGKHLLDPKADSGFLRGRRTQDHREIASLAYEKDGNTPTGIETDMPDFIRRGAIRIDGSSGSIDLAVKPTFEQQSVLRRIVDANNGDVYVDFGDGWNTDHSAEYERARADRVINDIRRYFDEGYKPEGNAMFSIVGPEQDAEYMKAVEDGDMEKAQRMVAEAAKRAMPDSKAVDKDGNPLVLFHGTPTYGFTEFAQPGESLQGPIWVTDDKRYAEIYANQEIDDPNKGIYRLFADVKNPVDLGYIEDVIGSDAWNSIAEKFGMTPEELHRALEDGPSSYEQAVRQMNYIYDYTRGEKFVGLLRTHGYDGAFALEEGINRIPTIAVIDPSQVKSAEPVTYDDNGNVIPLSQRFNDREEDIRYSIIDGEPVNLYKEIKGGNFEDIAERISGDKNSKVSTKGLSAEEMTHLYRDVSEFSNGDLTSLSGRADDIISMPALAISKTPISKNELRDRLDGVEATLSDGLKVSFTGESINKLNVPLAMETGVANSVIDLMKSAKFAYSRPEYSGMEPGHKVRNNVIEYLNYVTKFDNGEKEYYCRFTIERFTDGGTVSHGAGIKEVEIMENSLQTFLTALAQHQPLESIVGNPDTKLLNFFVIARTGRPISEEKQFDIPLKEENVLRSSIIGTPTTSDVLDLLSTTEQREARKTEEERRAYMNESEKEEDQVRYSVVTDQALIDQLESEPKRTYYRAAQMIDGQLYPPMAAMVEGEMVDPIRMDVWEQSDERPDLAIPEVYTKGAKKGQQKTYKDGTPKFVFNLDKGKRDTRGKKSSVKAAYNPYIHSSTSPLNDQFASAWARPNLVIMTVEVPESEATSGYRAEKAKDSTGELPWKSGPVSNALKAAGKPERKVFLSRYDKPTGFLENDKAADEIASMLEGVEVAIPFNTVTPGLRDELVKRGVKIGPPEKGNAGDAARPAYEEWLKEQGGKAQGGGLSNAVSELDKNGISINDPALMEQYGLSDVTLSKKGDVVTLNKVVAAQRNQGNGTRFMEDLTAEADRNGWTLALTPDKSFGASSVSRLKDFYKRFGFKDNKGRNTDFAISESMVRRPEGGMRFSFAEQQNKEYIDAVQVGDMEKALELVLNAAKKAGYGIEAYHGSYRKGFTKFDDSHKWSDSPAGTYWFTSKEAHAQTYRQDDGDLFHVALSMNNPIEIDAEGMSWDQLPAYYEVYFEKTDGVEIDESFDTYTEALEFAKENGIPENAIIAQGEMDANAWAKRAKEKGYDGLIIRNVADVYDTLGDNVSREEEIADDYVVFDPSQIKSADPVTYDDNGNVIPLSERFNDSNDDIRFSIAYHAGDLGKAESNERMGAGRRSTGHFGTGTYFVGDKEKIIGQYKDRPLRGVELDDYNLFKPGSYERGRELHDLLRKINYDIAQYPSDWPQSVDDYYENVTELRREQRKENPDLNKVRQIATPVLGEAYVERQLADGEYGLYQLVKRYSEDRDFGFRTVRDHVKEGTDTRHLEFRLSLLLRRPERDIHEAIVRAKESGFTDSSGDTPSTIFMKALGFEGVDVRGVDGLDNTIYGSVVYDVQPESIRFSIKGDAARDAVERVDADGLSSIMGEGNRNQLYKDAYKAVPREILSDVVDGALKSDLNVRGKFNDYLRELIDGGTENDETGLLRAMINRVRNESGIEDLTDDDIRYMLWRDIEGKRSDSDLVGLARDLARKRRWTEGGPDYSITGTEEFKQAADEAREEHAEANEMAFEEKREKVESFRESLNPIVRAMAAQRRYDKSTIDGLVKFARQLMKAGNVKGLGPMEVNILLADIRSATGKNPAQLTKNADRLMDLIIDRVVKDEEEKFKKLVHTKGKKLSNSGVEVVGTLDKSGLTILKTFRDKMGIPKEELANWIEERETAMSSAATDAEKAEARDEWRGGSLALDYLVEMDRLEGNRRAVEEELGKENAKPRGERDGELIKALEENLRENRMDMVDVYRNFSARLADIVAGSKERVKAFKEKQAERVEAIHRAANFDLAGISADSENRPKDFKAKLVNNPLMRLANMPLATFHDMLQIFGRRSVDGRGYLFNWLMPEAYEAEGNASRGLIEANDIMDAKVQELFGDEGMRWRDLYKLEDEVMDKIRENTGVDLSLVYKTPQSGQYARPLTVGNALYIYMVDKMSDGRMKLRKMGIEAEHVARLKQVIEDADPRMIQLVDWVQEVFFPDRRNKYNAVYEQIYGTPMAAIEDYVTLRVNKNERYEIKSAEVTGGNGNLTNITGSIIKRRVNTLPIDILHTDAFSLVQEHIQQMEEWAAYAQFREDLKSLLSYKTFQNKASQMTTIYGSGDELFKNFEALCAIVAKQYNKAQSKVDAAAMSLAGGATSSAIAARLWTATKQFASFVTFFADASPAEMVKAMEHWKGSWKWNIENLPLQEKRWRGRNAGYDILDATQDERDILPAVTKARDWFGNWSMIPNAFVDFATTSMGSKATYETKIKQYLDAGFSEEAADRKAKFDAQEAVNTTQQSSSPSHLSELQAQRTFLSSLATMFRNGPFGFTRRYVQAINQAGKYFGGEDKRAQIIDFEKRRAMDDGLNEEQARDYAENKYEKGKWKAALNMIVMGYLAPLFWNLMGDMPYLAFGDDEKLKKKKLKSDFGKALLGPLEGLLFGGNLVSSFWGLAVENKAIRNSIFASSPMLTDVDNIVRNIGSNNVRALNDLIVLASKTALGVNPQTLTDGVAAVIETFHNDLGAAEEFMFFMMRIMNVPQSQLDDLWIDELQMSGRNARGRSVTELAEIYANYKLNRETPFTNYLYSKDEREERVENKAKTLKSKAKQRKEDNKKKSKK